MRGSFDNANEHARQREEERLAKRQKPKRKKFKIVMMHGYEQSVPWTDDDDDGASAKKQPSVERPIEIKRKAAKLKKRNHDEKIALLKSLRSGSAAHDFNRRRSPSETPPGGLGVSGRGEDERVGGARRGSLNLQDRPAEV